MLRMILSLCCLLLALPATATKIDVRYVDEDGHGYQDTTATTPGAGNPGTTKGEQAQVAFEYVSSLVERTVWIPDEVPLRIEAWHFPAEQYDLIGIANARATSAPGRDLYGNVTPIPGVVAGFAYPKPLEMALSGQYGLGGEDTGPHGGVGLTSGVAWDHSTRFQEGASTSSAISSLPTILHEYVHILGFTSGINYDGSLSKYTFIRRNASGEVFDSRITFTPHIYDRYMVNNDISPRFAIDMTDEQRATLYSAGNNVRLAGPATLRDAPRLLTAGHDGGEVFLYAEPGESGALAHLSHDLAPASLMAPGRTGGGTLELNIVASILSDMGWGPVVDSQVAIEDAPDNTLRIAVDSLVAPEFTDTIDNLRVNVHLPEGLSVDSATTSPAECDLEATPIVCDYTTLASSSLLEFQLSGADGDYDIKVDVDHRSLHVDPTPVNNFAAATFVIGPQLPPVPLNTPLLFTANDYPEQYVVSGLGRPGPTLTWSTAHEVHFDFMLAGVEGDILVDLRAYPYLSWGQVQTQNVTVTIDGHEIAQWQFRQWGVGSRQLRIPAELIRPGVPFRMTFHLPDAAVPAFYGTSPDVRLLGLGFISMTFSVE